MINREERVFSSCLDYIPPIYREIEEFQELANIYNLEINKVDDELIRVFNNFFINTLDEQGCQRWEKICKIKINSNFSLEDRRFAIKVKLLGTSPYTKKRFDELLTQLVGKDNYKLIADYNNKNLSCFVDLGVKNQLYAVRELLENILQMDWTFDVELLFNTHEILSAYTHEHLGRFTHNQLREERF